MADARGDVVEPGAVFEVADGVTNVRPGDSTTSTALQIANAAPQGAVGSC